ncbi:MAG: TGS domain-containing protein [Thermoprotei archaeon]
MPTNLPPQAQALWIKAQESKTPYEKLERLQEFLSAIPAHKGTEKLRHQVRHQIAVLRDEVELAKQRRKGTGLSFLISKEGAFQGVLIGVPGSGKSHIFNLLTGMNSASSYVSFETVKPVPGMMRFQDINIQLVDTPSITRVRNQFTVQACASARNGDLILIVVDATEPVREQLNLITEVLEQFRVHVRKADAMVKIERRSSGGIQVLGNVGSSLTVKEVSELLGEFGVHHALVVVSGPATLDDVESSIIQGSAYKPALCLVTKLDCVENPEAVLKEASSLAAPIPAIPSNSNDLISLLGSTMLKLSGFIRVYTKPINQKDRSGRPMIMRDGDTVESVVRAIHTSMLSTFDYARVWGNSVRFQGAKVGLNHVLRDGDTIEIHA